MAHLHISSDQSVTLPRDLSFTPQPAVPQGMSSNYIRQTSDVSTYQPGNTITLRLPSSGRLWDVDSSYMALDVTLNGGNWASAAGIVGFNQFAGVLSLFSRIRMTASNGTVVIDTNSNADYLHTLMHECLLDVGSSFHAANKWAGGSGNPSIDNSSLGAADETSGAIFSTPGIDSALRYCEGIEPFQPCGSSYHTSSLGTFNQNVGFLQSGKVPRSTDTRLKAFLQLPVNTTNVRTYTVNPLQLFFQHGAYVPLTCGFTIELYLNQVNTALRCVNAVDAAVNPPDATGMGYSVSNVKYVMRTLNLPEAVRQKMDQVWKQQGLFINLTNVTAYTGSNSSLINTQDIVRVNAFNRRNISGFLICPRISSAVTDPLTDSYRRFHPDFDWIQIKFGDTIVDNIQSDAEAYRHTQQFFSTSCRNLDRGMSNTYGADERGYWVIGNDTLQNKPDEYVVTPNTNHKWFSSWLLGFDMRTVDSGEVFSGVSNADLEISYRLKTSPGSGSGSLNWTVFLFSNSIMKLSYSNVCEIAS